MKRIFFILLIIIFFIAVFVTLSFFFLFSGPKPRSTSEHFVVGLRNQQPKIIEKLYSDGFIRNKSIFEFILIFKKGQGMIKPGGYFISKSMWVWEIADALLSQPSEKWVIVLPGQRKEEIAEVLGKTLGWQKEEKEKFLLEGKEGYLFPDTYLIPLGFSGEKATKVMMNNFNEKVGPLFTEAQKNDIRNDTLIVLASLVQRESANEEEMPLVAGIIWNRWLDDMYLSIDATIQYVLGKPGNWWPRITSKDYKIESLYNTYLYKGRPPAPICNPSLEAIRAVIFPQESDFLYYLHDRTGQIHPARTYQEHLENIDKYLNQ